MKKIKKRVAWVLIFTLLIGQLSYATDSNSQIAINSQEDFYKWLDVTGKKTSIESDIDGRDLEANYEVYKKYQLVVYGGYNDVKSIQGANRYKKGEYEYLGYGEDGKTPVGNPRFEFDDMSGNFPWDTTFDKKSGAFSSWSLVTRTDVKDYIENQPLYYEDYPYFGIIWDRKNNNPDKHYYIKNIDNDYKNYTELIIAPTLLSKGNIKCYNGGHYANFVIASLGGEIKNNITCQLDIMDLEGKKTTNFVLPVKQNEMSFKVKVTSTMKIADGINDDIIDWNKAILEGVGDKDLGDYNEVNGELISVYEKTVTLKRHEIKENMDVSAKAQAESVFGDEFVDTAAQSIHVDIEKNTGGGSTVNAPYISVTGVANPRNTEWHGGESMAVEVTAKADLFNVKPEDVYTIKLEVNDQVRVFRADLIKANHIFTFDIDTTEFIAKEGEDEEKLAKKSIRQNFVIKGTATLKDGTVLKDDDTDQTIIARGFLPPTARISCNRSVKLGDPLRVTGSGRSPNGFKIKQYFWELDDVPEYYNKKYYKHYFETEGEHDIYLQVADVNDLVGEATKRITVKPPTVNARIGVSGVLKPYRAMNMNNLGSSSPERFPIVHEKTKWDLSYSKGLIQSNLLTKLTDFNGKQNIDFTTTRSGDIDVSMSLENTKGYKDMDSRKITIEPDLPPVADFNVLPKVYRDVSKGKKATLTVFNHSNSPDGDTIGNTKIYVTYDANNNGRFTDDTKTLVHNGANIGTFNYPVSEVGKYLVEMRVEETYTPLTGFEDEAVYLWDDTSDKPISEKVIEVDNQAPSIDLTLINKKPINIAFHLGDFKGYTKDSLKAYIDNNLKPSLEANGYKLNYTTNTGKLYDTTEFIFYKWIASPGHNYSASYQEHISQLMFHMQEHSQYTIVINPFTDEILKIDHRKASNGISEYLTHAHIYEDNIYYEDGKVYLNLSLPYSNTIIINPKTMTYEIAENRMKIKRYTSNRKYYMYWNESYKYNAILSIFKSDGTPLKRLNCRGGYSARREFEMVGNKVYVRINDDSEDYYEILDSENDMKKIGRISYDGFRYISKPKPEKLYVYKRLYELSEEEKSMVKRKKMSLDYKTYYYFDCKTGEFIFEQSTLEYEGFSLQPYLWLSTTQYRNQVSAFFAYNIILKSKYYQKWKQKTNFYDTINKASFNTDDTYNIILDESKLDIYSKRKSLHQQLADKLIEKNASLYLVGNNQSKSVLQPSINATKGGFATGRDFSQSFIDYLLEKKAEEEPDGNYLLLNSTVSCDAMYYDYEEDPMYSGGYRLTHVEPNYFENSLGVLKDSGVDKPLGKEEVVLDKVGKFTLEPKVRDNPKDNDLFDPYRKWSKDGKKQVFYVHRKPIADFEVRVFRGGYSIKDKSYDLDHQSLTNKGIKSHEWQWRKDDGNWHNGLPNQDDIKEGVYYFTLRVRDLEGAWSDRVIKEVNGQILEKVSLTLKATLKDESLVKNEFSADENLTWLNISTTNDTNNIKLEIALYDGSKKVKPLQSIDYSTSVATKDGTDKHKLNWNNQDYYVSEEGLTDGKTYQISIKAIDSVDKEEVEIRKPVKMSLNKPPVIESVHITPEFIYEGDNLSVDINVFDEDLDPLKLKIRLKNSSGINLYEATKNIDSVDHSNPNLAHYKTIKLNNLVSSIGVGNYLLELEVSDPSGEKDTYSQTIMVNELNLTGTVQHAPQWNENRKYFNLAKTNTENSPRGYDTFWSGERFILQANTTIINEDSQVKASTVTAEIIEDDHYKTRLHKVLNSSWEGELWDNSMIHKWGNNKIQPLVVHFKVKYSNGTAKTCDITVFIDNREEYFRIHRKQ